MSTQERYKGSKRVYRVQQGDSLYKIAQKLYGNAALWTLIYRFNIGRIGENPDLIDVGMELVIPNAEKQKENCLKRDEYGRCEDGVIRDDAGRTFAEQDEDMAMLLVLITLFVAIVACYNILL